MYFSVFYFYITRVHLLIISFPCLLFSNVPVMCFDVHVNMITVLHTFSLHQCDTVWAQFVVAEHCAGV